ncbi:MAG TPA: hypothetical protein VNN07_02165 [Candidatus Tectomicrobia bacterium]|nr:hypothetical protein [Candidatus Tectomicrobia bacterium]
MARAKRGSKRIALDGVRVLQVSQFTGERWKQPPREFTADEIAIALDFLGRLDYNRVPDQYLSKAHGTLDPLRGLVEVLRDAHLHELEAYGQAFLAEALEFLTVRLEIASEPAERRRARYVLELPKEVA